MSAAAESSLLLLLLLLCAAAFVERGAALHLCTDRLFNNTQGRHNDGLPHLTPTEEATWMALLPRRLRGGGARTEFDWLALYRSLTRGGGPDDGAGGKPGPGELLTPASLHDVRLHGDDDDHLPAGSSSSMYWQVQQTNLEYLLYLDPDRLTWTFRQQAGLPTVGDPYGGWEAPGGQLRGHFTGSLPIFKSRCRFVLLVRRLLIRGLLCDSVLPLAPRSSTCYSSLVCFRRALSERERAHVGGHAQQHPQGEDDEGGGHSLRLPEEDGHGIPLGVSREHVRLVRAAG
jgi:hypothetical protein